MPDENKYLMDDPREAGRLAGKVNTANWFDKYFVKIGGTGQATLEVGCGPGVLLGEIKKRYPKQNVTGVDISFDRVRSRYKGEEIALVQANGLSLPFSNANFDSVYTRFLLEYLPDPEKAVGEMARVCKPGGKVMLQDLDAQLVTNWPINKNLESSITHVIDVLASTGFDPFVGRKLYSIARSCGLENIDVAIEPYHLIVGAVGKEQRRQWELKLDIARPIIEKALGSRQKAVSFIDQYLLFLDDPDTFTYSNLVTVIANKPLLDNK